MFVDVAKIRIKAGDGGAGAVSFHREKYVAAGGPDGGDGGKGGDVIFQVDTNISTLVDFKYKRRYFAPNGEPGRGSNCSGKNAQDLIIYVPKGTVIKHAESGRVMADLSGPEPVVVARGGKGGGATSTLPPRPVKFPGLPNPACPGRNLRSLWN